MAQVFGYNLDRGYTSRPKSCGFDRPKRLRSKSHKLSSSANTRKKKGVKTKNDTTDRESSHQTPPTTKKNTHFRQDDHQKGKNIPSNNLLSSNVISSSSGKIIDIINSSEIAKTNTSEKRWSARETEGLRESTSKKRLNGMKIIKAPDRSKQPNFSNSSSRRTNSSHRRRIPKKNVEIYWNDQSEITGLFPYLLNSIRESKSSEERFSSDYFFNHCYRPRRNSGGVIFTLNLPENQIPQTSDCQFEKPPSIPLVSPSVIFGQKKKPKTKIKNKPPDSVRQQNKQPKQLVPISKMLKEKSGLGPEIIDLDQSLHGLRVRETGNFESDQFIWSARNSVRELLTEVIGPYKIPLKTPKASPVIKPKIEAPVNCRIQQNLHPVNGRNSVKNRTPKEQTERKPKGILKPPTPRFYYDRMKDIHEGNVIDKSVENNESAESVGSFEKVKNEEREIQISHRQQHSLSDNITLGGSDNVLSEQVVRYHRSPREITTSLRDTWELPHNHLSERRVQVDKLIEDIADKNG